MRIDLLLVLGLQDQNDLDWHEVVRVIASRQNQLWRGVNRKLCGILRAPVSLGCAANVVQLTSKI